LERITNMKNDEEKTENERIKIVFSFFASFMVAAEFADKEQILSINWDQN